MQLTKDHLKLVTEIYSVVLDESGWPSLLDKLADLTGACATNTIYFDKVHDDLELSFTGSYFDVKVVDKYVRDIAPMELPLFQSIAEVPAGIFYSDEEVFQASGIDFAASPVTEFFRREAGIYRRHGIRLNEASGWLDCLTFNFPGRRGEMTDSEKQIASVFTPHLAKAMEISRPFKLLKARFKAVLSALDQFHIGTFILSGEGTVVIANTEASRILEERAGISLDRARRLKFASQDIQAAYSKSLARLGSTNSAQYDESSYFFRIPTSRQNSVLLGELISLGGTGLELEKSFQGGLLLVIDPDNRQHISTKGLEMVYGLSSAESEVCRLLIDGLSTAEIADCRGVGRETVKTQIGSVLRKTGTNQRVELVKTAHSLDLPVNPPLLKC